MRTKFSETEILIFLQKKKNEIVADEMIMKAISRPENRDITFSEMLTAIHEIGMKQGNLEGRLELMNELFSFFEL